MSSFDRFLGPALTLTLLEDLIIFRALIRSLRAEARLARPFHLIGTTSLTSAADTLKKRSVAYVIGIRIVLSTLRL